MSNIYIIDDDVELAEQLEMIFRDHGHTVTKRDHTEGAVEALAAGDPDLLVLDVMFPENPAGGFDLARDIRRNPKLTELPIIMLTSINQALPADFSAEDIDEDWMPVTDFLEKPVALDVLISKVDKLLKPAES